MIGEDKENIALNKLLLFDNDIKIFALNLLSERCSESGASKACILTLERDEGQVNINYFFPLNDSLVTRPVWIDLSSQTIVQNNFELRPYIIPLTPTENFNYAICIPLKKYLENKEEYACYYYETKKIESLPVVIKILSATRAFWNSYSNIMQNKKSHSEQVYPVLAIIAAISSSENFKKATMAFCNELAVSFAFDRVAIGFLKGRFVSLAAISHAEKIGRKMDLPRAIEMAMEECIDQDSEVTFPATSNLSAINRSAEELVRRFGSKFVISFPIRYGSKLQGALVCEYTDEKYFSTDQMTLVRLALDLATPRLMDLKENDKWIGSKLIDSIRYTLSFFLGAKHTWAKLAGICLSILLIFMIFFKITYRVDATALLRPQEKVVVAAAFDGFIQDVFVDPGQFVEKNYTLLACLDDKESKAKLISKEADVKAFKKEAALAIREKKTVESQIAIAKAEQSEAECNVLKEKIAKSLMFSSIDGIVLSGEWKNKIGSPVKLGETIFEIAKLENLEAEIFVLDEDILDIKVGQKGKLSFSGNPSAYFNFIIKKISPSAEVIKQKNVFRVIVDIENNANWLRPGMEGVAKVEVDKRRPIAIWTKKLVNWLRMKLWI